MSLASSLLFSINRSVLFLSVFMSVCGLAGSAESERYRVSDWPRESRRFHRLPFMAARRLGFSGEPHSKIELIATLVPKQLGLRGLRAAGALDASS